MGCELPPEFFVRPTLTVAREMVGAVLCVEQGDDVVCDVITEVEAYNGFQDKANHASRGRTKRTEPMFKEGGHIYIYLIYGMYWMLNVVTGEENYPAAVLIRKTERFNGPGILTRELGITKSVNGERLGQESGVWIEKGTDASKIVKQGPRIGVGYAGEWTEKPYRFYI